MIPAVIATCGLPEGRSEHEHRDADDADQQQQPGAVAGESRAGHTASQAADGDGGDRSG